MLPSLLLAVSRGFLPSRVAAAGAALGGARALTASRPALGMEEFFAAPLPEGKAPQRAGRSWLAAELRLKSFEDLHRLWFVCLKERNYLLTERLYFRQMMQAQPEAERLRKVKKTMGAIKVVIGERARARAALEEDLERQAKVAAVAAALAGGLAAGRGGAGAGAAAAAAEAAAGAGAAVPVTAAAAAAAPAAPAYAAGGSKKDRRSAVLDTEEERARAALHRRKELLHVPVTFKKFGRKYTATEEHPAPEAPTRAERTRADKTRRFFARARALQAAPPTLPASKALAYATGSQL